MLAPRLSRSSLLRAAASIGVRHGSTITMKNGVLAVPNDPIIPFIEGAGEKSRVDFGMARCHGLWRRLLGPPCLPIPLCAPMASLYFLPSLAACSRAPPLCRGR